MNIVYNQLHNHILPITFDNWRKMIETSIPERPEYRLDQGIIHIGQVVGRFLGIPIDEDEYYNSLFELVHKKELGFILLGENILDKSIDNHDFQAIQKVLMINQEQALSINRFVAFLDGEKLIPKSPFPAMNRKIREAMKATLEVFQKTEDGGLKTPKLRRVLVDIIKWSKNHLTEVMEQVDPTKNVPKFLWYGDCSKSQAYFVFFLMKLGSDVVMFQPNGNDPLHEIADHLEQMLVHRYQNEAEAEPFPTETRRRKSTVAYRASREIETVLNHEGSGLYKPWQLRDYTPSSVTLKTTYDELFILIKEKAMIRPDFEVKNGEVKIPAIFSKIQGVSRNRKEYWDRLHSLTQMENTLFIRHFPFTKTINNDFRFHYRNALGKDGLLNTEAMLTANYWMHAHLPTGLQKGLAFAIRKICENPMLKPQYKETVEDVKIYLFTQAMQIPNQISLLLQKFDYSQDVPKLVLYNNELNGTLSRSDAALLLLLNQFGIDIVIYNPPGHNDVENFIDNDLYDTHWQEDVVFEQEYKEPSLLKKLFHQRILKNLRGD